MKLIHKKIKIYSNYPNLLVPISYIKFLVTNCVLPNYHVLQPNGPAIYCYYIELTGIGILFWNEPHYLDIFESRYRQGIPILILMIPIPSRYRD